MRNTEDKTQLFRETAYDSLADWCDGWYADHWRSNQPFETIVSLIDSELDDASSFWRSARILDAATGTGNTYVALTRAGLNAFGTDGSLPMILKAEQNCISLGISTANLIAAPMNWLNLNAYLEHFEPESFDLIVVASNSFCHMPPVKGFMDVALANFGALLRSGGLIAIDTKRFECVQGGNNASVPREMRFDNQVSAWVEREHRKDIGAIPGHGQVTIHTRMVYDRDPSFASNVNRAIILVTVCRKGMPLFVDTLPYYPLKADVLQSFMTKAGFDAGIYRALEHPLMRSWTYDMVIGRKL